MTSSILKGSLLHLQPSLETQIYVAGDDGVTINQTSEVGEISNVWISFNQLEQVIRHLECINETFNPFRDEESSSIDEEGK